MHLNTESSSAVCPTDCLAGQAGADDSGDLIFADEIEDHRYLRSEKHWVVMIVDDDPEVHSATKFALTSTQILNCPLRVLHAYSSLEARALLHDESDIAVILLDVVMETNDAGLVLTRAIRDEMNLHDVRIILRTGQPGYAPEIDVISHYDINDYKTKSELTHTRLITSLTAAIRSYRQIVALNESRRGLEMIIRAGSDLLTRRGVGHFAEGILTQIAALLGLPLEGLICAKDSSTGVTPHVVAAAGSFRELIGCGLDQLPDETIRSGIGNAFDRSDNVFKDDYSVLFFDSSGEQRLAAYVSTRRPIDTHEQYLLQIFCQNIALANDNLSLIDRLHQLAYVDPLSELPNRACFIEAIAHAIASGAENYSMVAIDVDHFGAISETIGYRDANRLLAQIGRRLRQQLPAEVEIARISGDAFGAFGRAEALKAQTLATIFEEPIDLGGLALTIGVTTGRVAFATLVDGHAEDIVRSAFIALKRGKEERRGSDHEFTPALAERLRQRTSLSQELRQAIKDQEFFLVFQPQVDLITEKAVGVEALIRWRRKNGDYVSPDRFIDVAENSGMIILLGEFVMRMACMQLVQLRAAGFTDLRMAINVSMVQWLDRGFPDLVESILQEHRLPPQSVELEITESVAMQGAAAVREVMMRFRGLGLQMALDDFGTGFSSLSYLQQLPVHRLKIDRAFVGGMEDSKRNQTLAETVVRLGQNLGLSVIAEGVENQLQANILRALGCHEAQGFHYARPLPSDDLLQWLRQHQ